MIFQDNKKWKVKKPRAFQGLLGPGPSKTYWFLMISQKKKKWKVKKPMVFQGFLGPGPSKTLGF